MSAALIKLRSFLRQKYFAVFFTGLDLFWKYITAELLNY